MKKKVYGMMDGRRGEFVDGNRPAMILEVYGADGPVDGRDRVDVRTKAESGT